MNQNGITYSCQSLFENATGTPHAAYKISAETFHHVGPVPSPGGFSSRLSGNTRGGFWF